MKVILKENLPSLGYKDDVVEVKSGYGRNYLIPKGLAIIASDAALKQLAEDKKQQAHKVAKIREDAESRAAALEGVKLVIPMKAGPNGATYGSVNAARIAEELVKLGHDIDRKIIEMEPVKMLGAFQAVVHFLRDVQAAVDFEIIAEEEEA